MSAATILFMDIVSFSKKPTSKQQRLVTKLTGEVIYKLRTLLNPPTGEPNVIALPSGDGMALIFLHSSDKGWDLSTILHLIFRLQEWAFQETTSTETVRIRFGVHVGQVEFITDINGKTNVCGDTINYTQRVMDAANSMQVLFSDAAFREYIGPESPEIEILEGIKFIFSGPFEIYAKHGVQIPVYKVGMEPEESWWSNDDPIAKHLMIVAATPLPKEIVGSFSDRLEQATYIAFIQLTGDRFLEKFNNGDIKLSQDLKRFWVFMPDPDVFASLKPQIPFPVNALLNECIEGWKSLLSRLKKDYPNTELKLGLFKEPPYFGASFINWERPGGSIHVSPYVWSIPAPKCPGYDLHWLGKTPSSIYETYVEGLNYIHSNTINVAYD